MKTLDKLNGWFVYQPATPHTNLSNDQFTFEGGSKKRKINRNRTLKKRLYK